MILDPSQDGVTHINVYSKGATELGRLLSNFAHTPFEHPIFGKFQSMEGYWYYIKTGFRFSQLRSVYGASAKVTGRELWDSLEAERYEGKSTQFPHFNEAILDGIRCKLKQNRNILQLLQESTLPLTHYYFYGTRSNPKVIDQPQHMWQIEEIERIRSLMQARK